MDMVITHRSVLHDMIHVTFIRRLGRHAYSFEKLMNCIKKIINLRPNFTQMPILIVLTNKSNAKITSFS